MSIIDEISKLKTESGFGCTCKDIIAVMRAFGKSDVEIEKAVEKYMNSFLSM